MNTYGPFSGLTQPTPYGLEDYQEEEDLFSEDELYSDYEEDEGIFFDEPDEDMMQEELDDTLTNIMDFDEEAEEDEEDDSNSGDPEGDTLRREIAALFAGGGEDDEDEAPALSREERRALTYEDQEMQRRNHEIANAKYEEWIRQLPIREAEKEELRQRRAVTEERNARRMELSEEAAIRARRRMQISEEAELRATHRFNREMIKPAIAQPKPITPPKPDPKPSISGLTWGDISLLLDPNEISSLESSWMGGSSGAGAISQLRLRWLMSALPVADTPTTFMLVLKKLWKNSGSRGRTSGTSTPRVSSSTSGSSGIPRQVRTRTSKGFGISSASVSPSPYTSGITPPRLPSPPVPI